MRTEPIKNGLRCYFNHSPWPFYIRNSLLEHLGGVDGLENMIIENIFNLSFAPRRSSEKRPYKLLDWKLWQRNVERNERYWRYERITHFNTQYYGYGHYVEDGSRFQFYNWRPEES